MDLEVIKNIIYGTVPPALFAFVVFTVLWWRGGRRASGAPTGDSGAVLDDTSAARRRLWLAPLLLAAGYIPTHIIVLGMSWPPASSAGWLPVVAAACALLTPSLLIPRLPAAARWAVIAAVVLAAGGASVANLAPHSLTTTQLVSYFAGFLVLTLAASWSLASLTRQATGPAPVLLVLLPVTVASQVLTLPYYSLLLGQAAGVVAGLLGGVLIVSIWKRRLILGAAAAVWSMLLTMTCLFQGVLYGYADHPMIYPPLVAASPVAALIARRLLKSKLSPAKRTLLELAAAVLPLAAAMALAIANRPDPSQG